MFGNPENLNGRDHVHGKYLQSFQHANPSLGAWAALLLHVLCLYFLLKNIILLFIQIMKNIYYFRMIRLVYFGCSVSTFLPFFFRKLKNILLSLLQI